MSGTTSTISQIVAQLESGNGEYAGSQPASMVDPIYGQYAGFANQYGSGAAGVDNYAAQVLAANPNATLGDFYASYVLGTGNPASLSTAAQLESEYPSAYNNLVNNSGYDINTPLASLLGGSGTYSTASYAPISTATEGYGSNAYATTAAGADAGGGSEFTGTQSLTGAGTFAQGGSIAGTMPGMGPGIYGGPLQLGVTPALSQGLGDWFKGIGQSVVQGFDALASGLIGGVVGWVERGFLVIIAVVIIGIALVMLMSESKTVQRVTAATTKAAALAA